MRTFHIIKDMDGVETNWDKSMEEGFKAKLPGLEYQNSLKRKHWEIRENYPKQYSETIASIWYTPGFFFNLDPMPNAIEATVWILEQGFKVTFCTTPLFSNDPKVVNRCIDEKREWLYHHYKDIVGAKFFFDPTCPIQFVDMFDKTILHGNILIDDKPIITGRMKPTWKHILFDEGYPFSKDIINPRINWNDKSDYFYQKVLKNLFSHSNVFS